MLLVLALALLSAVGTSTAGAVTVTLSGTTLTVAYTATDATTETVSLNNDGTNIVVDSPGYERASYPVASVTGVSITRVAGAGSAQTIAMTTDPEVTWSLPGGVGGSETQYLAGATLAGNFSVNGFGMYAPITLARSTTITSGSYLALGAVNGPTTGTASLSLAAQDETILYGVGLTRPLDTFDLTVTAGAGAVNPNAFLLPSSYYGGGSASQFITTGAQTWNGPVILLGTDAEWRASGVSGTGEISPGDRAQTLTIDQTETSSLGSTLSDGSRGGSLILAKAGTGTLALTGANTYSGTTDVTGGTLRAGAAAALGATSTDTTVRAGGRVEVAAGITSAEPITTSDGGTLGAAGDGGAFSGALTMNGATTVDVPTGSTLTMAAAVTGSGVPRTLTKSGPGTLVRGGAATNTKTVVSAGTVRMDAASATGSSVTVGSGGQVALAAGSYSAPWSVAGSGAGQGAAVQPVAGAAVTLSGAVSLTGNATIGSPTGSTLTLGGAVDNFPGAAASSLTLAGPGTIVVTGAIGANPLADPDDPDILPLASLSASAPLTLSGGAVTTSGAQSYSGAMRVGADLALTASTLTSTAGVTTAEGVSSATVTLDHGSSSSLTGDVSGGVAIVKDGGGTLTLAGTNTYTGATTVADGILRAGSSTAFGNTSAGTTVAADAQLQVTTGVTSAEPLAVAGNGLLTALGTGAALNGAITLSGTPEVYAPPAAEFTLGGIVSGSAGLRTTGSGTLVLGGANTYTGATAVDTGTVRVTNNAGLGASGTGTAVAGSARLEIAGGVAIAEPVTTGEGSILAATGTGTAAVDAPITLSGSLAVLVPGSMTLNTTVSMAGSGAQRAVTKSGSGTLHRGGSGTNLTINVVEGTLSAAPGALGSAVTIADGAQAALAAGTFTNDWTISGQGVSPGGQGSVLRVMGSQSATLNGGVVLGANATIGSGVVGGTGDGTVLTLAGAIDNAPGSGAHALTLIGPGSVAVAGTVGGGAPLASFTATGPLALSADVATAGTQTYSGATTLTDAASTLTASTIEGTGSFVNDRSPTGLTTLTVNQSGEGTFAGEIGRAAGTSAERNISLVKQGAGTITLSGANGMTGTTDLQAGAIEVSTSASLATSAITAAPGTSVNGGGTIAGTLTFVGTGGGGIFPRTSGGAAPATLTTGAVTGAAGRFLSFIVDGVGTAGTDYSRLDVNGAIDLTGVNIWTNGFEGTIGDTVTIVQATGGVTGRFTSGTSYQGWRIDYRPNHVDLVYVGAPPVVNSISPARGSTAGGDVVTIGGLFFTPGTTVSVGGASCVSLTIVNSTEMRCTTPAHAPGAVSLVVTNPSGSTVAASPFTFVTPAPPPPPSPSGGGGSQNSTPPSPDGGGSAVATVARPRYVKTAKTVTTAITTTGAGRLTQVITSRNGRKTITRCTTGKAVGSGPAVLACRLNAGARAKLKSTSLNLTVVTTWVPSGGSPRKTTAKVRAPRG